MNDIKTDIEEVCGRCHWFVDKGSFSCCHFNPPQFQLTPSEQLQLTGKRSWWTHPYVSSDEIACSAFESKREKR